MKERIEYRKQLLSMLSDLDKEVIRINKDDFWIIQREYEYLEYYSFEHRLTNTAIALRLAVALHNGSYRKSTLRRVGETYKIPYVQHCLWVCKMLADLSVPVSREEEDILLAASLCHDMIEDIDFAEGGIELYTKYHLDKEVYDVVKLVSKRYDFSDEEEKQFFHNIESNKLALLVKLSDRCHNVEDLYNRNSWKVHEYINETRTYFIPMCEYGLEHYPDLKSTLQIFHEKMINLTLAAEILVDRYDKRKQELMEELDALKAENEQLRKTWAELWEFEQDDVSHWV